jgi:hypothetical protein
LRNIFYIFLFLSASVNAQFTDRVWCFGDSAGINFNNLNNPTTFKSQSRAKGSCVSISDQSSNLLFYAHTRSGMVGETTLVYDSTHNVMQNGNNIVGQHWYRELTITSVPNSPNLFYLFCNGVTNSGLEGLYYSVIDMTQNGGLGAVIQKNILLSLEDFTDAMIAIKHGNGRDWWLVLHTWNNTNDYYVFSITPSGISGPDIQSIGSGFNTDRGPFAFTYATNEFVSVLTTGLIEKLSFDRCTGQFSNLVTIHSGFLLYQLWASSISPSGQYMYVSNTDNIFGDSLRLYQFDLQAGNIFASRQTIYKQQVPASGGMHATGPDGKIYITCLYEYGYPYADSIHNVYSDNLSVINSPDSGGLACDFQPFSFYLGGNRTYWGLPNNPDYEAGPWVGSPCDTLVGITEQPVATNANMFIYYSSQWQTAFINANNLTGNNYLLQVFDITGKEVFSEYGQLNSRFLNKDLNCENFAKGIFLIRFKTGKQNLVKKFVVYR